MRRGLVTLAALVLVFGFAKVFGSIGGGSSDKGAQLAANESTKAPASASTAADASTGTTPSPTVATSSAAPTLPAPSGTCDPEDLSVTPVVEVAHAVNPVTIALKITGSSPACNFTVRPKSVAVKIVSGSDRIWSSQDCPRSVPRKTVVVRSGAETTVPVTWSGRRSNGTCATTNKWALPGYYHVLAAVIGSTPADTQFQLTVAPRAVITKTAKPKPGKKSTAPATPSKSPSSTPSKGADGKGSSCGGDNAAGTC